MWPFPFITLFCADTHPIKPCAHLEAQSNCIQRFINPPTHVWPSTTIEQGELMRYFLSKSGDAKNPCTWNGVHCSEGVIESLKIHLGCFRAGVDMDWLPPTVRSFSLDWSAIAREWTTAKLPRQLRFLLLSCIMSPMGPQRHMIDFCNLPRQMEELYLCRVAVKGRILIGNLPESMRIVEIRSRILRTAVIDFEGLPANLVSMSIAGFKKKKTTVKIVGIGRVQKDQRVSNTRITQERRMSMTSYEDMFPASF